MISEITTCDECGNEIPLPNGARQARVMYYPARGAGIGDAFDPHDLCVDCDARLVAAMPKFANALRLVQPVPPTDPAVVTPPALDSVTAEELLTLLAAKLGVQIVKTDG